MVEQTEERMVTAQGDLATLFNVPEGTQIPLSQVQRAIRERYAGMPRLSTLETDLRSLTSVLQSSGVAAVTSYLQSVIDAHKDLLITCSAEELPRLQGAIFGFTLALDCLQPEGGRVEIQLRQLIALLESDAAAQTEGD